MNNFISTLIERSIETKPAIQPRVTGKFEAPRNSAREFQADENAASQNNDIGEPDAAFHEKRVHNNSAQKDEPAREQINLHPDDRKNVTPGTFLDPVLMEKNDITPIDYPSDKFENNITSQPFTDSKESLLPGFLYKEDSGANPNPGLTNKMNELVQFSTAKDLFNGDLAQVGQKRKTFLDTSIDPEIIPPENLRNATRRNDAAADHRLNMGSIKMQAGAFPGQQITGSTKTVNVHIGRIEVRVFQPATENTQKTKTHTGSGVEEFLNKRNGLHK